MGRSIITLTTDFGTEDGYVGAVKGVIKRINPEAEVVDITHRIEPFDVLAAAFALNNFYRFFPPGTIHMVVVDPGVGSPRQPLAIRSEDFFFVGPDNGIFSFVYENERMIEMVVLSRQRYFLAQPSSTFHARDIFAPVSAYLSLGVDIKEFGGPAKECFKLKIPEPALSKKRLEGEVIHVDRFGNLITNIKARLLEGRSIETIGIGGKRLKGMVRSYFDIPKEKIGALVGSSGFLEIATNQGNAQRLLKAKTGTSVKITFA